MVFPFLPCSSTCVTGQRGSGKTRFVFQLLKTVKDMYVEDPPNEIMYCFGIHQPLFEEMEKTIPSITFHQGLLSPEVIDEFTADRRHHRVGRFDAPSRTERGHGIVIYPGTGKPFGIDVVSATSGQCSLVFFHFMFDDRGEVGSIQGHI